MKTFYGEHKLKDSLLKYTKEHQSADAYKRGKWLLKEKAKNGSYKGCFYGCMVQSDDQNLLEKASAQFGIPLWYVHVTEGIYEGLPEDKWLTFPYEAIEVLPVGIDLNLIRSEFNKRLLLDQLRFCQDNKHCLDSINQCIDLFNVSFNKIDQKTARSAERAARAAERSARSAERSAWSGRSAERSAAEAARAAACSIRLAACSIRSAAESAESAESAACSAAESVRAAAWSAEAARAARAARSKYFLKIKEMLFDVIRNSEVAKKEIKLTAITKN